MVHSYRCVIANWMVNIQQLCYIELDCAELQLCYIELDG
jgi:hypothetical protein